MKGKHSWGGWAAVIFAVTCLVWVLLSQVSLLPVGGGKAFLGPDGLLSFLEHPTINARFSARGGLPFAENLIYVNVDSEAIATLGNFPWNRETFAVTLDALFKRGGIRAAGLDFVFSPSGIPQLGRAEAEAGSLALGKTVREHGDVVLAAGFTAAPGASGAVFPFVFDPPRGEDEIHLPEMPGFPIVGPTWGHLGLINTVGDGAQFVPFFARCGEHTYFPLSLELAFLRWGVGEAQVKIGPSEMTVLNPEGGRLAVIPLVMGQLVEPNWFAPWDGNPQTSLVNVLAADRMAREGTEEEKAEAAQFFEPFRDALVLIGPTDPFLKDVSVVPLSGGQPVPRVSIHGNLLQTIISGRFLLRPPVWANVLVIFGLGFLAGAGAMVPVRWERAAQATAVVAAVVYVGGAFFVFSRWDWLVPMIAPVGAALSCGFLATAMQLAREQRQKRRIQEMFGSYVSSAVVKEMVEKNIPPQTGGAEVEITAFFSDIVSFSPIAEEISPTDLVELMSEYLGEGTAAVMAANGTLDKYVGDAIVSIFGAPLPCRNHAAAACRAALALQEGQMLLRSRWVEQEGRWPARVHQMSTRVGLNTGPAIVGNIGSKLRFNYTMMGDTVNLAARLEGAAGYYGAHILVSGETFEAARRDDAELVFRALDRVLVPGRTHPVDVFELLGSGGEVADACESRILAYAGARAIYRDGRWDEARQAFLEAAQLEPEGRAKNPASAMARRCEQMADRPAARDFVFPLTK
jgi:adenylate cyclase